MGEKKTSENFMMKLAGFIVNKRKAFIALFILACVYSIICIPKVGVVNDLTEYLPEYARYGRTAPLKRNITIIENADLVLAFWDGASRGTKYVIDNCKKRNIPVKIYMPGK